MARVVEPFRERTAWFRKVCGRWLITSGSWRPLEIAAPSAVTATVQLP